MKTKIFQTIIALIMFSCSSTKNVGYVKKDNAVSYDFSDILSEEQLNFIQRNYGWKNEKILIINYTQPMKICHYDNTRINSQTEKWWKAFYSDVDTENCLNIQVVYNGERYKRKLDNVRYFDDKEDFLFSNFFGRMVSCEGVMVVNDEGYYIQFNGHYYPNQVSTFIEILKNLNPKSE